MNIYLPKITTPIYKYIFIMKFGIFMNKAVQYQWLSEHTWIRIDTKLRVPGDCQFLAYDSIRPRFSLNLADKAN